MRNINAPKGSRGLVFDHITMFYVLKYVIYIDWLKNENLKLITSERQREWLSWDKVYLHRFIRSFLSEGNAKRQTLVWSAGQQRGGPSLPFCFYTRARMQNNYNSLGDKTSRSLGNVIASHSPSRVLYDLRFQNWLFDSIAVSSSTEYHLRSTSQ